MALSRGGAPTPALPGVFGGGREEPRRHDVGDQHRPAGVVSLCALLVVMFSLALAGCGKRNAPQPPPDVPNTYPRPYPSE